MTLTERMKNWLITNDLKHTEQGTIFSLGIKGTITSDWKLIVHILTEHDQIVVYSILPNKIEQNQRDKLAKELIQLNFGLRYGNFEMNLKDGTVRFKTVLDTKKLNPESITDAMLHSLIYTNTSTFDQHMKEYHSPTTGGI